MVHDETRRNYNYEIDPRPAHAGGGWQLRLLEDGIEVGGRVFPADADADPEAGMTWWTEMTEADRAHWLTKAKGETPRDAREAYLRQAAYDEALAEANAWLASRDTQ